MDYIQFDSWMSENPTATGWIEWIMFPSRTHYTQELVPTDIDILTQMTHCRFCCQTVTVLKLVLLTSCWVCLISFSLKTWGHRFGKEIFWPKAKVSRQGEETCSSFAAESGLSSINSIVVVKQVYNMRYYMRYFVRSQLFICHSCRTLLPLGGTWWGRTRVQGSIIWSFNNLPRRVFRSVKMYSIYANCFTITLGS